MSIENVVVGALNTNCYVLKKDGYCIVIDPGDDFFNIKNCIGKSQLVGVIITHYHFDHIGALEELKREFSVKVYDYNNLKEGLHRVKSFIFYVVHTPGHKKDSISIYFEKENALFSGDFIFNGSIGRYDFFDSSLDEMKISIKKILTYPDNMIIYPGHGPITKKSYENAMLNYYLNL